MKIYIACSDYRQSAIPPPPIKKLLMRHCFYLGKPQSLGLQPDFSMSGYPEIQQIIINKLMGYDLKFDETQ